MVKYRQSAPGRVFDFVNHLVLTVCALVVIAPLLYLLLMSLSPNSEVDRGAIIPRTLTLDAYRAAFTTPLLLNSFAVSLFVTLAGTAISMFLTVTLAYSLSKAELPGRKLLLFGVTLTLVINAGIIPLYLLVRSLQLLNSIWSLIVPSALSAFNVILIKNFFLTIPDELEDAAQLDGCSEFAVLWRVVLPLSKPALATFGLFYAISYWNSYFNAVMFINDPAKMPFQVILHQLFAAEYLQEHDLVRLSQLPYPQILRAAALVLSVLPVLAAYPWVQKHFTTGVLLGGIKE